MLTKQEFLGLITSLAYAQEPAPAHAQSQGLGLGLAQGQGLALSQKPFAERAKRAFQVLNGMLGEILWYGSFQQLLYVMAKCLSRNPKGREDLFSDDLLDVL